MGARTSPVKLPLAESRRGDALNSPLDKDEGGRQAGASLSGVPLALPSRNWHRQEQRDSGPASSAVPKAIGLPQSARSVESSGTGGLSQQEPALLFQMFLSPAQLPHCSSRKSTPTAREHSSWLHLPAALGSALG